VFYFNLGPAQWVLALLGIGLLVWRKTAVSTQLLFFTLAASLLIFLMLPASTIIWENLFFMPFFQFPWRLLGATAAMLAILGGAGVAALMNLVRTAPGERIAVWVPVGAVAITLLLALPLSRPAPWPDFGDVFTLRMSLIELSGRWLGTTSTADYVPTTVDTIPKRNRNVIQNLYVGLPMDRVNRQAKPDEAEIIGEEITPLHFRYQVSTPKQFRLRLFLFAFPGWEATVDGRPAETELARPEGFIIVIVPEGEHEVEVQFKNTPARNTAVSITVVSLIVTLLVAGRLWRRSPGTSNKHTSWQRVDWLTLAGTVGITAVSILIVYPAGRLTYNSTGQTVEPATVTTFADFGDQIALLGYDVHKDELRPGETFNLNLYWKAENDLDINYQSFVHILRPDGTLLAQSDHLNPGEFPTRRWPLDKYVRDDHYLQIPAGASPGDYTVSVGLWVQAEGWRLPLLDASGAQIGDNAPLFNLTVLP
ncbi:MAG: hypothetical protein ACE5FD_12265, partial [Anaerolineae bacterium]